MSDRRGASSASAGRGPCGDWAVELDGVEPVRAVAEPSDLRAGASSRSPTASAAGTSCSGRATSTLEVEPGSCSSGAGFHCETVGVYVPREPRVDPRHVRRTGTGGRRRADRRLHAACRGRPRRCRCRGARRRRGLGARRAPGDRLARLRPAGRQDRRPRELIRERGEARGAARRGDRPARRAVRGHRRRRRQRRSAARRAGARRAGRARTGLVCRVVDDPRGSGDSSRPSTSCCSAKPRRSPPQVRNAGAVFVGPSSPVAGRRLRDGREPRATHERLGADGRRARARDVHEAGDDPAAHTRPASRCVRPTAEALAAAEGMPAHAAAVRHESARARVPALRVGGADRRGGAPRGDRPVAGRALRPEHASAAAGLDRPGDGRRRARRVNNYPAGGYVALRRAIADYAGVEPENVVLGVGADDLILLCARGYAGPATRS